MNYLIAAFFMSPGYILGMLLLYAPFADRVNKSQKRKLLAGYTVTYVINLLGLATAFSCWGISMEVVRNDMPVFGAVITLINILVIPGRTKEHLLTCGISMTCNNLMFNLTLFISVAFWGQETVESYLYGNVVNFVLLIISYYPLKKLMIKTVKPFMETEADEYWSGVWIIPLAMYFAMFFSATNAMELRTVRFLFSRVLIAVVTVSSCYAVSESRDLAKKHREMEDQLDMQKNLYAQMEGRVMEVRKLAHDFKHHLAVIQRYIDTDDRDGLQDYCWELGSRQIGGVRIPYTGNSAVDGVMYRYAQLAKEKNVSFEYMGSIGPCVMSNMDLSVLLGNALDNAITGCLTLEKDRSIRVIMQTEPNMISVLVHNTFDGIVVRREEEFYSRKRDNEPGIGMTSMRSICESYGAEMNVSWDSESFSVLFLIPVEKKTDL